MGIRVHSAAPLRLGQCLLGGLLLLAAAGAVLSASLLPSRSSHPIELSFLAPDGPPVVVAVAGFPGCGGICPPALASMSSAYRALAAEQRGRIDLLFINVQRDADPLAAERYARSFHENFRSWNVTGDDTKRLYTSLAIGSYPDARSANRHGSRVYVFGRRDGDWFLAHVFPAAPSAATLSDQLARIVRAHS